MTYSPFEVSIYREFIECTLFSSMHKEVINKTQLLIIPPAKASFTLETQNLRIYVRWGG